MYAATIKHLKIGEESDVITVVMAAMTFQYGDIYFENKFGDNFLL